MKVRAIGLRTAVVALMAAIAACREPLTPIGQPRVTEPTTSNPDRPGPPALPFSTTSASSGWRIVLNYGRAAKHTVPLGVDSQYLLYGDGTFSLTYHTNPTAWYNGTYARKDSEIVFTFDNRTAPWSAVGTLRGDSLLVRYNESMAGSSFESGAYLLSMDHSARPGYIHVAKSDGSAITPIARGSWPTWSPDGRRIAFHRDARVYLIDADGRNETPLAEGGFAAWSPDGTRIAFTGAEGIRVMGVDGSGARTIVEHGFRDDVWAPWDMGVGKPSWSPDGRRIAFEHFGDGDMATARLYMTYVDAPAPRSLTSPVGAIFSESDPSWSPDGTKVAFWSYGFGITTIDVYFGSLKVVYSDFPNVAYGTRPTWSADSGTLAFTAGWWSRGGPPPGPAIWTAPSGGGAPKKLIEGGFDAAWSPDGKRIAFVRGR